MHCNAQFCRGDRECLVNRTEALSTLIYKFLFQFGPLFCNKGRGEEAAQEREEKKIDISIKYIVQDLHRRRANFPFFSLLAPSQSSHFCTGGALCGVRGEQGRGAADKESPIGQPRYPAAVLCFMHFTLSIKKSLPTFSRNIAQKKNI